MKLYKVYFEYGNNIILDMCFAEDMDDLYRVLKWNRKDEPRPVITEVKEKKGCFLSHHILSRTGRIP